MENGIIRVAIGGQGRSGYSIHARHLEKDYGRYQIVAVADQIPERRKDARNQFGARTYKDWTTMIAAGEFDLFVNALPSPLHTPATIAALNAGAHVLCEKPMAKNLQEFDRMVAAAKRNNRVLAPFQNNRPQPFFEKMCEIIDSGVLGKIVYIRSVWGGFARRWDWQTWQDNLGGSLYNTGPHGLDQSLKLFGFNRTPKVFCRMDSNNAFGADAEDHCTVTLYDPKREAPQIDMIISAYMAYSQGDMYNVCGTYGGLTGGATELKWRYFNPKRAPKQKMWNWSVDRKYTSEDLPWKEGRWTLEDEKAKSKDAVGYTLRSFASGPARIYANLHEVLTGDGKLEITLPEVRKQIAVIAECHKQNKLPRREKTVGVEAEPTETAAAKPKTKASAKKAPAKAKAAAKKAPAKAKAAAEKAPAKAEASAKKAPAKAKAAAKKAPAKAKAAAEKAPAKAKAKKK